MGLFDGFEKLINEHGSATILEKRIELIKDQYAALEGKLQSTEARAEKLEAEKSKFELDSFRLKERVRELEEQLLAKKAARLEEIRESILVILSEHPGANAHVIMGVCRVGLEVANFHLEELESQNLIYNSITIGEPLEWYLGQEGRRYLISHGLIK